MDKKLRERDLLWCRALVATLGTEEIEKVTAEFNRIRPDKAVEHMLALDGFPPSHRDEPFCECSVCMGFVSRKTAASKA